MPMWDMYITHFILALCFWCVYLFWVVVLLLIAIFHKEARGKNWQTTRHLYWKYDWYKKIMPGELKQGDKNVE